MKKIIVILMLLVLSFGLCACDKNANTNKVTEEQWNAIKEAEYINFTVTRTFITTTENLVRDLKEQNQEFISEEDLERLESDEDAKWKRTVNLKYTKDYIHEIYEFDELLDTDIEYAKKRKKSENIIILYAKNNSGYYHGYANQSMQFNVDTNSVEECYEWVPFISSGETKDYFTNMGEYADYEYNSKEDCYVFIEEIKSEENDESTIAPIKNIHKIYFNGDKVAKIQCTTYYTKKYKEFINSTLLSPEHYLSVKNDEYVFIIEEINEFKDYDNTVIEIPNEVKKLMGDNEGILVD